MSASLRGISVGGWVPAYWGLSFRVRKIVRMWVEMLKHQKGKRGGVARITRVKGVLHSLRNGKNTSQVGGGGEGGLMARGRKKIEEDAPLIMGRRGGRGAGGWGEGETGKERFGDITGGDKEKRYDLAVRKLRA